MTLDAVGYMKALVMKGVPLEFFIEGGRCRDGTVNQPKLGILSNVVDIFFDADLQRVSNQLPLPIIIVAEVRTIFVPI